MPPRHPLAELDEADREFVLRFVLGSGSLKALAKEYGVSYPTIRAMLDRVIERLEALDEERPPDPMAELLAELVRRGELAGRAAKRVRDLHRQLSDRGRRR